MPTPAAEKQPASAAAMEEIQGSSEAKARLLTKLKAGLKYEEGRLKRLEDNREAMLEEERKRR